ncbi:YbdK family carboxylate-amine ligase [Massilia sp. YIM B02443]|uniref:YbdK family carboxylate-amine ligase n=1 Tax=Massilia sp. YIM B02443 TaxID=3050127 RepID=UPI0025B703E3|nr:YbdK family carboxylate-amine ligase [Massilia sp. YIM B02443]MDN4039402.1 YbdK family carboxylate-amine ligase [Massilia sp. YIM B02443]
MPLPEFAASSPLTMGVELELQLVGLSDFDLAPASPDMLDLLNRKPFPGAVTPEITQSMIEVNSSVHTGYAPLVDELHLIRDTLLAAGDRLNVGLAGGGTHPFQQWSQRRIYEKPRFKEVSSLYGYLAKQFTVFGQHVHIGCGNGDQALFLLHALNRYIPHFIALSASSPFLQGSDTAFQSARLNSVFAFPLSGRAPFLLRWEDFERDYFKRMEDTGIVRSMKDFYWDLRPKPEYGTIELRVCDTPLTVEHAAALAAYLQALCSYLLEENEPPAREDDYLVYNYNRFQACRFGLDGTIVLPQSHESVLLRDDILATLERIAPHAERLGAGAALPHLARVAKEGGDAWRLRAVHEREGSVESLVNLALRRFRGADD